ncbi:MAG TPA: SulP family inorganic anion transporter [Candidatus Binataceae bacterium]|nr:SulP family inorganic anion transporter [Candidatus Binataceae bacterium]
MNVTLEKPPRNKPGVWLFRGIIPIDRAAAIGDVLAGFTLAAMNVPQALGYTRIAGMPVVTGLYTLLLPLIAFATFGSSRYLVVAADSATAAILAGSLSTMAPIASAHYVALAGMVALLTAGLLLLARLFRLGFLADFLSQTVLVGFLTGVGFQVGIAMLGDMLGVRVGSRNTVVQFVQALRGLPQTHVPTLCLAAATVLIIVLIRNLAPRIPGAFFVVTGAIAASAAFGFAGHGIKLIQDVTGGLPPIHWPDITLHEIPTLFPVAGSCFLMIVAQSSATSHAYASRHRQTLNIDADLVGLAAANISAALTGTFVVNGSPTQTAMVESSGGRSQIAHLTTAGIVAVILLFLAGPLHYLPRCVLAAVVFTIAIKLVDLRGLRDIWRETPSEFGLALITAAVVVVIGVEQGILLAMALSLLRHLRHSYRPYTAVLIDDEGYWRPTPAVPGTMSGPGLIIFQFGADLFYANANRFVADIRSLIDGAATPVKWLVVDAAAITSIDYSASSVLRDVRQDLGSRHVGLILARAEPSLRSHLEHHGLISVIGADHIFFTLREALAAINEQRISPE